LIVFTVLPLALMMVFSVAQRGPYGDVELTLSGESYRRALEWLYVRIVLRSIWLALATTMLCLAIGLPVAYTIATTEPRFRSPLLTLLILPLWITLLVRMYAWIVLLQDEGVLNLALRGLGLITEPLPLLYTTGAILLGMVQGYLPFMVLPIYVALDKLDRGLVEAAMDLGAKPVQTWRWVILPLILPGIRVGVILVFVPALGEFIVPEMLGGGKSAFIGTVIAHEFLVARDWPFGAALTTFLLVLFAVGLWLCTRVRGPSLAGER
jgi:spermidine/putrescine transport system permease protein